MKLDVLKQIVEIKWVQITVNLYYMFCNVVNDSRYNAMLRLETCNDQFKLVYCNGMKLQFVHFGILQFLKNRFANRVCC